MTTATALGDGAQRLLDEYRRFEVPGGEADGDVRKIRKVLQQTRRLGPVGADVFGLPADPHRLARLVAGEDLGRFAAGLVRASLDGSVAERLRAA